MKIVPWQRNLAALWLSQALTTIAFNFVFPFLPLYLQDDLGVQGSTSAVQWASYVGAAGAAAMSIALPLWGSFADRVGRRKVIILCTICSSLAVGAMGLVASPEQLLLCRLLLGAVGGAGAAANALIASSTPRERIGFALGLMQVGFFLGISLGPLTGGLLSDAFGYRTSFYVSALAVLFGTAVVAILVRDRFIAPLKSAPRPTVWTANRSILALPLFPTLIAITFVMQLGAVIVFPVLSVFVVELGVKESAATISGIVMGTGGVVAALSAITIGRLGDRIGHSRLLPLMLIGAALAYAPQAFVQEVWQLLALRAILGVFLGGMSPCANAIVAHLAPDDKRGVAFGLVSTATALALTVGPLIAALVVGTWGIRAVFLVTGGLFAVSYVGVIWQFRINRQLLQHAESGT